MHTLKALNLHLSTEDIDKIETSVPETLIDYLFNEVLNNYLSFDKGHGINHIMTVIKSSLKLSKFYSVKIPMVLTVAIYHDLGLKFDRAKHHIHSKEILTQDKKLETWFSPEEIFIMGDACEDHRASNSYKPRNIYGLIISDADRTTDIDDMITRCYSYSRTHFPDMDEEETYNRVKLHLREKYGDRGYAKLYLPESEAIIMEPIYRARKILSNDDEFYKTYHKKIFNK